MRVRRGGAGAVCATKARRNFRARMCGVTTLAFRARRSRYPDLLRKSGASRDVELDPKILVVAYVSKKLHSKTQNTSPLLPRPFTHLNPVGQAQRGSDGSRTFLDHCTDMHTLLGVLLVLDNDT